MSRARINPLLALPLLITVGLLAIWYVALKRENAEELPSALIGKPAPSLAAIQPLGDRPPPTDAELTAPGVKLVNFWASWCAPCRVEHPLIEALSQSGVEVIGINYKDDPRAALGFLSELGDPFTRIGADTSGRAALDWGIYGVPETFVVGADGAILLRYPGPLTREIFEKELKPVIEGAS